MVIFSVSLGIYSYSIIVFFINIVLDININTERCVNTKIMDYNSNLIYALREEHLGILNSISAADYFPI